MFCSCSHAASDDDEKTIGEKSRVTLCFHLFLTIRQTHSYFTIADLNCHCIELCICCMTMVVGNKSLQRQTQCVIVALCPPLHWGGSPIWPTAKPHRLLCVTQILHVSFQMLKFSNLESGPRQESQETPRIPKIQCQWHIMVWRTVARDEMLFKLPPDAAASQIASLRRNREKGCTAS